MNRLRYCGIASIVLIAITIIFSSRFRDRFDFRLHKDNNPIFCPPSTATSKILLSIKTGSTEIYRTLPFHIISTLQCAENYLIFSDVAQSLEPNITVLDAFDLITPEFKERQEQFQFYHRLQEYHAAGAPPNDLPVESAWQLDKWKNLPMAVKAYETNPEEIEWYVFIDADTYLSWRNLVLFLETLDPDEDLYIGSIALLVAREAEFSHGGSGYILSRAAMKKLVEASRTKMVTWEQTTLDVCCGDAMLAIALQEVNIYPNNTWPNIQGCTPATIPWTSKMWCKPAITWHKMLPIDLESVWKFEKDFSATHDWHTPILFSDYYPLFIEPHLSDRHRGWDNRLDDDNPLDEDQLEIDDSRDPNEDDCFNACERMESCIQWSFYENSCFVAEELYRGYPADNNPDDIVSGWMMSRVEAAIKHMSKCKQKGWVLSN